MEEIKEVKEIKEMKGKEESKMKDKILVFVIGLLVGSIITASGFVVCEKINKNTHQMPRGEKMQMMDSRDRGTRPEKPSDMGSNQNRQEPSTNDNSSKNDKTIKEVK